MADETKPRTLRERLKVPLPDASVLREHEIFWRDRYNWLLERGYQLRPRYNPSWSPSWKTKKRRLDECEDSLVVYNHLMDATRISDGAFVVIKPVSKTVNPHEVEIALFLSSEQLLSDPKNHCVRVLDTLEDEIERDWTLLVMPLLRDHDNPRFDTVGEGVEFLRQVLEGIQFLHKNYVAHRDIKDNNILMDARPLFPDPYHPCEINRSRDFKRGKLKSLSRTQRPVNYYLIDFGLSRRYRPEDLPPMELPIIGGDKTVPEFKNPDIPRNPFHTDIYYTGNFMRMTFTEGDDEIYNPKVGFDFLKPLIADMVQDDPAKRPTMDEVVRRFEEISKGLSSWKLRSRVPKKKDSYLFGFGRSVTHWKRRLGYIVGRVPPVPIPIPKSN